LVTLATYNERDNLAPLIAAIHDQAPQAEILVIDDNSPDGTGKLADDLAATDSRIHIMQPARQAGLGTASLASHALCHGPATTTCCSTSMPTSAIRRATSGAARGHGRPTTS